ncbi:EamA family transporter [uncultured Ruthenibacterium sp.]|uniref:EamA family transporter n=1 Tax=uncultured Ruthenibacterium sp. TaxID=1905347 RepID=UPI00349E7272
MWLFFALGSAFFAGLTAVLSKCGVRRTDSDVATAVRTGVVLLCAWVMVAVTGVPLGPVPARTAWFLLLSGLSTGASWLCYFRALAAGDVSRVAPVDKCSTGLTVVLAFLVLAEPVSVWKLAGLVLLLAGAVLLALRDGEKRASKGAWLPWAVLSAVFASLTSIFGKIGVTDIDSNLATALRTGVVLVFAWALVLGKGKGALAKHIPAKEAGFLLLSGLSTGASWLCYYRALQTGPASAVAPVDQLSILVTMAFSVWVLKEKLTRRAAVGLVCLCAGVLCMLIEN